MCSWLFIYTRYEINYVISDRSNPSNVILNNQKKMLTVECKTYKTVAENHVEKSAAKEYTQLESTNATAIKSLTHGNVKVPKVLCWVMTTKQNHDTKAKAVSLTWGKRCDKILFMSSTEDASIGSIALPVKEGRNNLWAKTREAFKYIHKNFRNDYDWFLKADDDTFVIMENLKYLLQSQNPDLPLYFGCRLKPKVKQGFMSGGAGYVLSREALKRFVDKALPNELLCFPGNEGAEDVEIGKCLQNINVTAGDSRDEKGKGRFFPMAPENHLIPEPPSSWYWSHIYYPTKDGLDSLSDRPISFHYISYKRMYAMEYLIYQVKLI